MVFSYILSLGDDIQPAAHGNGVRSYDSIEDFVKKVIGKMMQSH